MIKLKNIFQKVNSCVKYLIIIVIMSSCGQPNKIKIACVGDSITYGFGLLDPNDAYPNDLQNILGDKYLVKNFGKPGATVLKKGDIPYIIQIEHLKSTQFYPDYVIIILGTNDTKSKNWTFSENFVEDYSELINLYANLPSNPKVYISYIPPIFLSKTDLDDEDINKNNSTELNDYIKIILENTSAQMLNVMFPLYKCHNCFLDGVHPNKKGASLIADTVAKKILEIE